MKILLLLGAALMATGCSFLPEKHIQTEIEIQAPPQTVWEILVNNEAYPSWNPYHVKVEGKMQTGSRLFVEIHKPNGEKVEIEPHVMRIIPFKELEGDCVAYFLASTLFCCPPWAISRRIWSTRNISVESQFPSPRWIRLRRGIN